MKGITMSISQYLELSRGNLTLKDIRNNNEVIAGQILKNEQAKKFTVTVIALSNILIKAYAEDEDGAAQAIAKIHQATNTILSVVQEGLYSLCILACIIEIGKAVISKRNESIPSIIMKYILAFGSIYFLPWIFNLIKAIFAN